MSEARRDKPQHLAAEYAAQFGDEATQAIDLALGAEPKTTGPRQSVPAPSPPAKRAWWFTNTGTTIGWITAPSVT